MSILHFPYWIEQLGDQQGQICTKITRKKEKDTWALSELQTFVLQMTLSRE